MTVQPLDAFTNVTHNATVGSVALGVDTAAPARVLGSVLAFAGLGAPGEVAERLLAHFGSLAAVLRAAPDELQARFALPTAAVAVIGAVLAVHRTAVRERLPKRIRIESPEALVDFLADELRHRTEEAALALFLDADFGLIAVEVVAQGGVDHCPVTVRHVVERALAHRASAVVLAHNHPSGNLTPSAADLATTDSLQRTLQALDMDLVEHVVIGDGAYSILSGRTLS